MTKLFESLGLSHAAELSGVAEPSALQFALDDTYGFDMKEPDSSTVDARCIDDQILVFNEFHETDPDAFTRRLGAWTAALDIQLPHLDLDTYEVVENLVSAINHALRDEPRRCFESGWDNNVALFVRESVPGSFARLSEDPV